ncbi:MAG TPA: hypothetical protein VNU66_08570, partial [Mycobacteriales bacterium]|nr:hypothetical protein [Mycobacteriales bacterium]
MSTPDQALLLPPGAAGEALVEVARWEWRRADGGDPAAALGELLAAHGLGEAGGGRPGGPSVVLLAGADGCAALAGLPTGRPSPCPAVPDVVAVVARPGEPASARPLDPPVPPGEWTTTWTDAEHAGAVEAVREAVARGDVYQVNVVGHRRAAHRAHPGALAAAVAQLPGAVYGGVL